MEVRSLKFIAEACSGELLQGNPLAAGQRVCTDSRKAQPGDVFFALAGERFDGHAYLDEVAQRGVAVVVVEKGRIPGRLPACAVIAVTNSRAALGLLGAAYRREFSLPVIAVAGSNGKTTTKEIIAAVLGQKFSTLASEASFNNDIGVPLTLLRLEKKHQAAVLEVGTNHPGELAPLVQWVQPRFGVITNIGREHLEFFGNLAGVAAEEGSLGERLSSEGSLFLNGDTEWADSIAHRTRARVVRVGWQERNEWRACSGRTDVRGVTFQVAAPKAEFNGEYRTNLLGRHQVVNALFAVAIGAELGLTREEIERGLAECQPPKMRLQLWESHGVRVLDDAYNANADSVLAALQVLKDLPCRGRRVAVLGDMAELGKYSEAAHREVGRRAAELGLGQLFTVGQMAPVTASAAREGGLNRVIEFADVDAAAAALRSFLKSGDMVLLKASRASRLERIAEVLRGGGVAARKN